MKHIVYLNNYMNEEIIEERSNKSIYSQPANNKIDGIRKALELNACKVKIISSGLVNNKTFNRYKGFISKKDNNLIYGGIIDIPIINSVYSIFSLYKIIKEINKQEKVDYIIFYNYKPEVAFAAYLSRRFLGISIIVEYEDGYSEVEGLGNIKKTIFKLTEKIISRNIDGAILVTSKLQDKFNVKSVVVRGLVNESIFKRRNEKIKNEKPVLMYSGGLDEERGIKVLIESLKYLSEDFTLIISGKGPYEYIVKKCKDHRVKFLGFLDYEEVKKYMIDADILINCQLQNHSFGNVSFPSKIFEYLSTGNLIISSSVSDVKEFSNGAFYIYENDDSKELAEAIKKAIIELEKIKLCRKVKINKLCEKNLPINIGALICREVLNNNEN